jgi:hypothetical protein
VADSTEDKQAAEEQLPYPPLAWPKGRSPGSHLGAPYPDGLDATNGCLFILIGTFTMAIGITCLILGTDVPRWIYWPLGIGVAIAALGEIRSTIRRARWHKVYGPVDKQLAQRDLTLEIAWGKENTRLEEIGIICGVVGDHMGWDSDHFMPQDPLSIVLWNHMDSFSFTETMQELEHRFHMRAFHLIGHVKTNLKSNPDAVFSDFINWVLAEIDEAREDKSTQDSSPTPAT